MELKEIHTRRYPTRLRFLQRRQNRPNLGAESLLWPLGLPGGFWMKRTLELFDLVLGHRRVSYWPLQASMPSLPFGKMLVVILSAFLLWRRHLCTLTGYHDRTIFSVHWSREGIFASGATDDAIRLLWMTMKVRLVVLSTSCC
ncbi:hypothetical protein AAZX31_19G180200 [Glycine max]